uniref:Uncharacterized protein n=1 Tax=Electrophorus electricus TaxID=8005 RepID=A0A4W4F4P4_ELEEL
GRSGGHRPTLLGYHQVFKSSRDGRCAIHLQVLVTFDTGSTSAVFQRRWPCSPGPPRTRLVLLQFPDWLVYQPDWRIRVPDWVLGCLLRAWVSGSASGEPSRFPFASAATALSVPSPLSRPFKRHLLCPSWDAETRWKVGKNRSQCPSENEVASLVSSLYGSTGEHFGITKSLQSYRNEALEYLRCAFNVWVLLAQPCRDALCGLIHHIDSEENYSTPSLFVTSSGRIHVQLQGKNGQSVAFLSPSPLPLGLWCLLSFAVHFCFTSEHVSRFHSVFHSKRLVPLDRFQIAVKLDDTDGYFVVGGGKFIKGIEGFYGPTMYYRTKIPSLNMVSFTSLNSALWYYGNAVIQCSGPMHHLFVCGELQAWLLSLVAAQRDQRLALLRLGHLHHVGDPVLPPDPDLSYAYYANIAKQTSADRMQPSSQQAFVESIHLNDEETLKAQTNENDNIFHWLKLQARRGVADAEQTLGRMLFWGQQGVSPDIPTAIRHYERGAVRLQDPVSMYDYAIVLLLGQGIPQDVPRAVTFLKKAMEQGFAPAITALGWYYEQYEQDYQRAVELWEHADLLENPDAAMNLGVLHLQGLYPGQAADKVCLHAYTYFLKSAQRGHLNGGIELAQVWSHGIPGHVPRRPLDAVLWVKWASEHNGYLGSVLRKGLNAYLNGNWFMALVYYLMSAECGFEAAQFNAAFLCEHSPVSHTFSSLT